MDDLSDDMKQNIKWMSPPISALSVDLNKAATILLQEATALSLKAATILEAWQQTHQPTEPIVSFEELFVKSHRLCLDVFEDEPPAERFYPAHRKPRNGSVIASATPEKMLEALNAASLVVDDVVALAHDETISDWIAIVNAVVIDEMELSSLQQATGLELVPLWLAVLFGPFELCRSGDFYDGVLLVRSGG